MKKKKNNIFLRILGGLFIVFLALFIASNSGYYESKLREKVVITENGIKEFEEKIERGEEVDITSFLNTEEEDYSSVMSTLGDNVTDSFESIVESSAKIFKMIMKSLF